MGGTCMINREEKHEGDSGLFRGVDMKLQGGGRNCIAAHLLHESLRVKNFPSKVDMLDDDSAAPLRKFCLTFYDTRAVVLDLALKLDTMRHLSYLPKYQQQMVSLEVMKVHAPLAHVLRTEFLSLELEDLSFRYLFPYSYLYVDTWLRSHETGSKPLIEVYKEQLLQSLRDDSLLADMVDEISVLGRYKSRYSTMKKLLRDGRKPEEDDEFGDLSSCSRNCFGRLDFHYRIRNGSRILGMSRGCCPLANQQIVIYGKIELLLLFVLLDPRLKWFSDCVGVVVSKKGRELQ